MIVLVVPERLEKPLEELVGAIARRTGEPLEDVRRAVEVTVLQRGIDALRGEEKSR